MNVPVKQEMPSFIDPLNNPQVVGQRPDDEGFVDVDMSDDKNDGPDIEIVDDTPAADQGRQVGATEGFDPDTVAELEGLSEQGRKRFDKMR